MTLHHDAQQNSQNSQLWLKQKGIPEDQDHRLGLCPSFSGFSQLGSEVQNQRHGKKDPKRSFNHKIFFIEDFETLKDMHRGYANT